MSQELEPIKGLRNGRTPADVIRGLSVLASCHGSAVKATKVLQERGEEIDNETLTAWRRRYPIRYADLHDKISRDLEEAGIRHGRESILKLHEAEDLALEKTVEALKENKVRDPAGTLQRLATTRGITTDKLMTLTGRPTQITENRSVDEIIRALRARVGISAQVIEEKEPAELPAGS